MLPEPVLFSCGDKSVLLVCHDADAELTELRVSGPQKRRRVYTFNSTEIRDQFKRALEARLLAEGFVPAADRRTRPRSPDADVAWR